MATTEILPFATGGGANVESQATYAADPTTGTGFVAGVAASVKLNKVWRQSSFVAAGLANFLVAQGISVPDDGNLTNLVTEITNGLLAFINAQAINSAGQCRLDYVSTTSIKLSPVGGNRLTINGVAHAIPAAGITVANPAGASTLYYVYAFMSGGTMTLETSVTGHSKDVATAGNIGVEIKTGDPTRSLVGMVRTDGAAHFQAQGLGTLSYFNRRNIALLAGASNVNFASVSLAPIAGAALQSFVTWGDEGVTSVNDGYSDATALVSVLLQAEYDGDTGGSLLGSLVGYTTVNNGDTFPYSCSNNVSLTEGSHYATLNGAGSFGTVNLGQSYARVTVRG